MIYTIAAIILFSFGPIFVRMGISQGLSPDHLMVMRLAVALPLLFFASLFGKGRDGLKMPLAEVPHLLLIGVAGMGGAMFCFFRSISLLGASLATMIGAITPAVVLVWAFLAYSRPVTGTQVVCMAGSFAGVALLMAPSAALGESSVSMQPDLAGAAYGFLAVVCSSGAMLGFEKYSRNKSPLAASLHITGIMALVYGAAFGFPALDFGAETWTTVLLLGVASWGVPFILFFRGIKEIGASNAALAQNAGPVITTLAAAALLGERLKFIQLAGATVIVVSLFILRSGRDRNDASPTSPDGLGPVVPE